MFRYIMMVVIVCSFTACDFDVERIFEIEKDPQTEGDGSLTWYRPGQVVAPVPPAAILVSDDVQLGYIIVFRPGPSAVIPPFLRFHIRGLVDKSLPDISGVVNLTYVPPPPPGPIEMPSWCIFDPAFCSPLFTEAAYTAGDFYYAVIIQNLGPLIAGDHDFIITIDPDDDYTPEDDIGNLKSRILTVSVSSTVYAN